MPYDWDMVMTLASQFSSLDLIKERIPQKSCSAPEAENECDDRAESWDSFKKSDPHQTQM